MKLPRAAPLSLSLLPPLPSSLLPLLPSSFIPPVRTAAAATPPKPAALAVRAAPAKVSQGRLGLEEQAVAVPFIAGTSLFTELGCSRRLAAGMMGWLCFPVFVDALSPLVPLLFAPPCPLPPPLTHPIALSLSGCGSAVGNATCPDGSCCR